MPCRKPSQQVLADEVGVDASLYSRIENGEATAAVEVAERIAQYFGVTVESLFRPSRYMSEAERTPAEA